MPPKEQFDKKIIIETAMKIVEQEGITALSARRLSKELKCSTAPIYRVFKSMDDLEKEVIKEILSILMEYTQKGYTPHSFLNVGVGIITFARDYKRFYRILFMDSDKYLWAMEKYYAELESKMGQNDFSSQMTADESKSILEKMSVFTHGLAALICSGLIKEEEASHEELIKFLDDTGGDIIGAAIFKRQGNSCDVLKEILGSKNEKNNDIK